MTSKKNILIIYSIFTNGGGETNLLNLLKYFKGNYNFTIAVKRYNRNTHLYRYIKENKIKIVTCPFPTPLAMSKIKLLWSILIWPLRLGVKRFDKIISLEFSKATPLYKFLFLKKAGKFIWTPIGNPEDVFNNTLKYKNYINCIDGVIVESNIHKSKLQSIITADKLIVINSFCFNSFINKTIYSFYNNSSKIMIGYLGRYDKNKGILELLKIFKEIIDEDKNLELSYFGNHGDAKEELQKLVAVSGLQEKVSVNGGWNNEKEYEEILGKVDFIVLPSKSEGLPLVLLESMAYGNPFVATNVGAIEALAENNPDVIIVDNNEDAIKKGILLMIDRLRNNNIDRVRLQKYYSNNFGQDNIVKKWWETFNI